jgi:hypothetical protein
MVKNSQTIGEIYLYMLVEPERYWHSHAELFLDVAYEHFVDGGDFRREFLEQHMVRDYSLDHEEDLVERIQNLVESANGPVGFACNEYFLILSNKRLYETYVEALEGVERRILH